MHLHCINSKSGAMNIQCEGISRNRKGRKGLIFRSDLATLGMFFSFFITTPKRRFCETVM